MSTTTLPHSSAVHRYFEVSLFLLLTVGFLALATTGRLDIFSVVLVTAALVVKALRYQRHHEPELSPETVTGLTWFYFVFYGVDLFFLSGGFLLATAHLILFLGAVKLFSARTNRDYLWLFLLAFMQLLAAATLTVDTTFLVFFFLFLVLGISTFISFEIKRGTETAQTAPLAAGTAGGRRLERSLVATSVSVALAVLVLAAVLFFIIPRVSTGYMSAYGFQPEQISGFTNEVSLGDIGSIKQNPAVVMRVRAESGEPQSLEGLKWRGIALTYFDGERWTSSFTLMKQPLRSPQGRFTPPLAPYREIPQLHAAPRHVQYRVLLEPISGGTLFVALVPEEIRGRFRNLWMDENGALTYYQGGYVQVGYDAISDVAVPPPEQLRAAPTDYPPAMREIYLQLPPIDPRVAELARQLTINLDNPYDKAREIERYLRTRFGYTLEMPSEPHADPVAYFLFERRRGHCEYFAASMTVLMRAVGIPARMVNGFLTGEYNEIGANYIVRAQDAHTWVEVYFPDVGWVEFDPTPPDPNPPVQNWWTTVRHYYDAFDLFWDEWVINYDETHQFALARQVRDAFFWVREQRRWFRQKRRDLTAEMQALGDRIRESPYSAPFGAVLVLAIVLAARGRSLVAWVKTVRLLHGNGGRALKPAEATVLYERLLRTLRRRGFRKSPGQTPLEFASSLPPPELAGAVEEFTRTYNHIRFGRSSEASPHLISMLRRVEAVPRPRSNTPHRSDKPGR
jgi:transglutaminase-like putative cysteine protease